MVKIAKGVCLRYTDLDPASTYAAVVGSGACWSRYLQLQQSQGWEAIFTIVCWSRNFFYPLSLVC